MNAARKPLRALVVDDEPLARRRIVDLLRQEPDVEVTQAANGPAAIAAIESQRPDIVFLDVQMPGLSGLDVVAQVGPKEMPATVFVTAHDDHAVRAFELAAVDYLVKPFDDDRFAQALATVRERLTLKRKSRVADRLLSLLADENAPPATAAGRASAEAGPEYLQRVPVESRSQIRFVPVEDIDYISSSGPYAELHVGDQTHLVGERMQALTERLDPKRFFRLHRTAIVQLDRIESLQRRPGGDLAVKLRDGKELMVSRARRLELQQVLSRRPKP